MATTFSASFRVWHPHLSAQKMQDALNMVADFSSTVGETRVAPDGRILGINRESSCSFRVVDNEPGDIHDHLAAVLAKVSAVKKELEELIASGGHADLFVGVFPDCHYGFGLKPDEMIRIASLGLVLFVEIYYD